VQSLAEYRWNDGGFRRKGFSVINILITLMEINDGFKMDWEGISEGSG